MFDCPAHIQFSPTSTSFTVIVFSPATAIVTASPVAATGSSVTRHFPSASAAVSADRSASVTTTFSPGAAFPHTGTGRSCCTTMWSLKIGGNETAAPALPAIAPASSTPITRRIAVIRLISLALSLRPLNPLRPSSPLANSSPARLLFSSTGSQTVSRQNTSLVPFFAPVPPIPVENRPPSAYNLPFVPVQMSARTAIREGE